MAYVDSSGQTHISLSEAAHGYTAQTTASRDTAGNVVGDSTGSRYAREQEAEKEQAAQQIQPIQQTQQNPFSINYQAQYERLQQQKEAVKPNTSGAFTIDTSEETVRRAQAQGLDVSLDKSSGKIIIYARGEGAQANIGATKAKVEAIQQQTYAEEAEKWKGALVRTSKTTTSKSIIPDSETIASKIGLSGQLKWANEKATNLVPSLGTIQEKRDIALEKVGLLDERQKGTELIRSNPLSAGLQDYVIKGYHSLDKAPVSFAGNAAILYGIGAVGGVAVKGVGLAGRAGLTAIGASRLSRAVEPTINVGLGAVTLYEASKIKTVEQGAKFVTEFALMGAGFNAGSKAVSKIDLTPTAKSLKTFAADETATLGAPKLELIYKEPSLKTKQNIDTYNSIGDILVPESMTKVNKISFGENVKLTPEMEAVLFSKPAKNTAPTALETRDIFSPEMTSPSNYRISSVKQAETQAGQRNTIDKITMGEDVKLTPEMEEVLFSKPGKNQIPTALETRDIFSPEMTSPSKYHISSIKQAEKTRSQGVFIPPLSYDLPFAAQDFSIQVTQKQRNIETILPVIPSITQNSQISDITISDTIFKNDNINEHKIPDPITVPDIGQFEDIKFPDPVPIDPVTNSDITDIIISPPPPPPPVIIPPPPTDIIISMGGKDWDFSRALNGAPLKRRKTKKKMLKNQYGDPFKIKLKL